MPKNIPSPTSLL